MDSNEVIDVDALFEGDQIGEGTHAVPIPLTSVKGPGLSTLEVEYVNDLPEYPSSHISGYTYVVAARGRSQEEMEAVANDIQYAKKQSQGLKPPVYSPFLGCRAKKWTWKCSGIFACEFLSSDIQHLHHTSVDESVWQRIQDKRQQQQILEADQAKQNAYSFYRAKVKFFNRGLACYQKLSSCKLVFKRQTQMTVHGTFTPYIGCVHEQEGFLDQHYRGSIQGHTLIDLQFLEDLFNKNIFPDTEECDVFEPLKSRRKFCTRNHPQGSGQLKHTSCSVVFTALVPVDIDQIPYLLFTSHGIHQHPPPPPSKPPEKLVQQVKQMIQRIQYPSMTTSQFLCSPQLEAFCQEYGVGTLSQLHAGFSNKDQIANIIYKERLLSYPNGQDINGLIFLQNTHSHLKAYIQDWYHDPEGTMVFCAFKESINLLSQLQSFKVDMSYKRLRSKNMNEVLFATYMPDQCKIITLLRVFTSEESTQGYYLLFKRAFKLIEYISQKPVLFHPIHGTGIYGIIVDMDNKQYTGLGQYLSELDSHSQEISWYLQRIIIFCRVHFQRTVLSAIGSKKMGSPEWSVMMALLDSPSEAAYDGLIECCLKYENENIKNWAIHKKNPVIKAGLCKGCSKINPIFFDQLRDHTNVVEQSHQKSNASGKYLTLVAAVRNSSKSDQDDIIRYRNFKKFNIHDSNRTSSIEENYLRITGCEENQKKRQRSCSSSPSRGKSQSRRRSQSSSPSYNDQESVQSSTSLLRTAATNASAIEHQRQELELLQYKVNIDKQKEDIAKQKEETREKQLKNDEKELEILERRKMLQESELHSYQAAS